MQHLTKAERLTHAKIALTAYLADLDEEDDEDDDAAATRSDEDQICDLVTDLLCLAQQTSANVDRILQTAKKHYEIDGGDPRLDQSLRPALVPVLPLLANIAIYEALEWCGARTLGDVVALTRDEILATPGTNPNHVRTLARVLEGMNLELARE